MPGLSPGRFPPFPQAGAPERAGPDGWPRSDAGVGGPGLHVRELPGELGAAWRRLRVAALAPSRGLGGNEAALASGHERSYRHSPFRCRRVSVSLALMARCEASGKRTSRLRARQCRPCLAFLHVDM